MLKIRKKRILIFGSEGSIGKDLTKYLSQTYLITKIDLFKNKRKNINIDLTKKLKNNLNFSNDEFSCVIILSFFKSQPKDFNFCNPSEFRRKNKMILNNSLKIIKKINCKKIIYFSSAAVYKNNFHSTKINENFPVKPLNIYSKFKFLAEKIIKKTFKNKDYQIIILRLFNIFNDKGNILINSFKKQTRLKKKIVINGDGNQTRDFIHTNDISDLIKKIEKKKINKFEIFNLCSGNSTSINQILKKINISQDKIVYDKTKKTYHNLVGNPKNLKKRFNWRPKIKFL